MPFVLVLLLVQIAAPTAEADRLFALGQQLYDRGDAAGAVAAFEAIAPTGWTAGALEYNWGTACLAADDLGCAVLHLERAERLMPGHAPTEHNLQLARTRASGDASRPASSRTWGLGYGSGLLALLGIGLALYLAAAALLGYRLWTRRQDVGLRRALVVLVPVSIVVLGLGVWAWAGARAPEAVVVTASALHDAPGAEPREGLAPGRLVRVLHRRGDWVETRLPDGARGWLPARAVEEI